MISTLTSAASAVGYQIFQDPAQATSLLAENLPKASNFYISYFIVQGLGIASSVLSQAVGFVIFTLVYKFLSGTPRALYTKWANLSAISWGSVLPVYTNIAVISEFSLLFVIQVFIDIDYSAGITYATIAPLMLGFATIGISIFYFAWRYNIFFVTDTKIDTRGLIYPRALKQLFAGIYIAELSMIGIFGASAAIGPAILMVVYLIFTALLHITINNAIDPLLYNLPRTLAEEQAARDKIGAAHTDAAAAAAAAAENGEKDGLVDGSGANGASSGHAGTKKPNFFTKCLQPWYSQDLESMGTHVPTADGNVYSQYPEEVESNAYHPPSVTSGTPLLWIPEDPLGISKEEVRETGRVIPITDEGCTLTDKNKLEWDTETVRPPVWEEKIYY